MISVKSKFYKAMFFLISILAIGVSGCMLLSGFSFISAIYITSIASSIVEFRDLHMVNTEEVVKLRDLF
ncbi:MAG: hypothetical protein ACI8WA_000821 [Polaribacter sp.]|jgi:hypothetical protein